MFNKSNYMLGKSNESIATSINQIGLGTTIKGDIISDGNIRIDGTLEGSLKLKGKLVVGTTGIVDGDVTCQNADISGTLKAQITVSELLSLKATAKLNGDIFTNKLAIEPGANFTGSCSMGAILKDIKDGERTELAKAKERAA